MTSSSKAKGATAGLAVGGCLTWNVSNVGAVADPLAEAYDVSLAAVGLLTTSLFVAALAAQLPAGRGSDRLGARTVALAAVAATLAGNGLLLLHDSLELALLGRALAGVGTGAAFVAGLDLVRAGGGGPVLQGLYGGATMVGGGLALMVVPPLTDATDWRAPYWTAAVLALAATVPLSVAGGLPRLGQRGGAVLRDPGLFPLGVLQAATFGLAIVAGNWVVPLLERQGASSAAAGLAGGLILFAGIVTRPAGGVLARSASRRRVVALALVGVAAGNLVLALGPSLAVSTTGALVIGVAAGLPFAIIFAAAQRQRPDAPAAAVGLVNGVALATILVATPIAGLAFELPGDGRLAFAAIATLAVTALLALRRAQV